ncbi:hypothetical protein AAG906_035861 [Vitis piasezkii]
MPKGAWESKSVAKEKQFRLKTVNTVSPLEKSIKEHANNGTPTDHMTSKSQLFHTYTLNPSNKKIAVANDSLATVVGSGRRIGLDKERKGLYHLESSQKASNNLSLSFLSSLNKDTILLYHLRLGHPSFRVLKVMFPHLFQ